MIQTGNFKKIVLLNMFFLFGTSTFYTAYSAGTIEKALYSAAAMKLISRYYYDMDVYDQKYFWEMGQQETGVYESEEAQSRVSDIYGRFANTGMLERTYKVYVSPEEDINAFMSIGGVMCINKGALDAFDDDERLYHGA